MKNYFNFYFLFVRTSLPHFWDKPQPRKTQVAKFYRRIQVLRRRHAGAQKNAHFQKIMYEQCRRNVQDGRSCYCSLLHNVELSTSCYTHRTFSPVPTAYPSCLYTQRPMSIMPEVNSAPVLLRKFRHRETIESHGDLGQELTQARPTHCWPLTLFVIL